MVEKIYKNLITKPEILFWLPILGFAVSWGVLTTKVQAIETYQTENRNLIQRNQDLIERIIILEEKNKNIQEDLTEIKADIKFIRSQVGK